eukprot:6810461-Pyramimonas_sp.AAC.2
MERQLTDTTGGFADGIRQISEPSGGIRRRARAVPPIIRPSPSDGRRPSTARAVETGVNGAGSLDTWSPRYLARVNVADSCQRACIVLMAC